MNKILFILFYMLLTFSVSVMAQYGKKFTDAEIIGGQGNIKSISLSGWETSTSLTFDKKGELSRYYSGNEIEAEEYIFLNGKLVSGKNKDTIEGTVDSFTFRYVKSSTNQWSIYQVNKQGKEEIFANYWTDKQGRIERIKSRYDDVTITYDNYGNAQGKGNRYILPHLCLITYDGTGILYEELPPICIVEQNEKLLFTLRTANDGKNTPLDFMREEGESIVIELF